MNQDTELLIFSNICNFVKNIGEIYKDDKSVRLYSKLVKKTGIGHKASISKHIQIFKDYCTKNNDAFLQKDYKSLDGNIIYSDTIYIDIKKVFETSDNEQKNTLWEHLLYISALVYPAGKTKEILKKNLEENKETVSETDFITNIIEKVEKNIDPNTSNPLDAISSLMKTNVFGDLLNSMNDGISSGKLDMNKLLSTVQGMMTTMTNKGDVNADMLSTLTSSMLNDIKK